MFHQGTFAAGQSSHHHRRRLLRGTSVTRSLRASKPISSLPEFEGTLALTRLLTRRLHVSSLSVCRHCVAHCVSQHVVKPRGPAGSRQEAGPRPRGTIDCTFVRPTISPQSNHSPLSCCLPFFVHRSRCVSFLLSRTLTGPPLRRDCARVRVLDRAKEGLLLYSFANQ